MNDRTHDHLYGRMLSSERPYPRTLERFVTNDRTLESAKGRNGEGFYWWAMNNQTSDHWNGGTFCSVQPNTRTTELPNALLVR